jgi:hypothetical protein
MGDAGKIFLWSAILFFGVIGILVLVGDIMH